MEDKWLNEWQKKLDGYEVAPPDGLWDGINKALEERRLSVASSRGRRTVWLRLAGIAAALAIVVPLGRNVCRPFYVSCRKSHSNRRHSSGAVGCLLGKSPESEKGIISW